MRGGWVGFAMVPRIVFDKKRTHDPEVISIRSCGVFDYRARTSGNSVA